MKSLPDVAFVVNIIPILFTIALIFSTASLWGALSSRPLAPSSVLWAAAGISISLGLLLITLRDEIPDFASILCGNCILLLGHTLLSCGVSRFSGRDIAPDLVIGAVSISSFAALYWAGAGVQERIILYIIALLIICARMLHGFACVPRIFYIRIAQVVLIVVVVLETGRLTLIFLQQLAWIDASVMTGMVVRLSALGALGLSIAVLAMNWPAFRKLRASKPVQSEVPDSLGGTWQLAADRNALITPDGNQLRLTGNEYVVLQCLGQSEEPVSRLTLNALIGRDNDNPKDRGIDILLSRLRKKCADIGVELPVTSVRGQGYIFHGGLPQI